MKHVAATFFCIGAIVIYSIFSYVFIGNFSDEISAEIFSARTDSYDKDSIEEIKECFENRKKILLFIANKEHLNEIESAITCLEYASMYNNSQDMETYSEILLNSVEEIKRASHTLY